MEYGFEFSFYVKEVVFSTTDHEELSPIVGIRLMEFPSLLVYPSNEFGASKRYPKGKYCTFLMPISKLLYQLNKTTFPIQLYIIDDSHHAALKVTSRGFCKDQRLLDSLVNLSSGMNNDQFNGKSFYNRTIVIPVFQESKYPIGSVTLKITAKIMQKHNCQDSLNSQSLIAPLEHCTIPTHKENQTNEATRNKAENFPNVWFPPPLCYTSKPIPADDTASLTSCEETSLIEHSDTRTSYNNSSVDVQHRTTFSALTDLNSGYVPLKRASVTTTSTEQSKKSTFEPETKHVCKQVETTRTTTTLCLQEYPCLSAMYRELAMLHSHALPGADRDNKDRKNQFVQTDPICDEDSTSNHENNGEISHLGNHENVRVHTERTSINESCLIKQEDVALPSSRESSSRQALSDSLTQSELHVPIPRDLSDSDSLTDSHISLSGSSSISLNKTTSNNMEPSAPSVPRLTVSQPNGITSNMTKQDFVTHSSPNLHHHDSTTAQSPSSGSLVNLKIPQHSMESTLTLGGTASNEVKCGNTSLGQKIYLAASLQSIDTPVSRHEDNKRNVVVSSSDGSQEVSDESQGTSVMGSNISYSEIQEIISDYEYSDDFESDSN